VNFSLTNFFYPLQFPINALVRALSLIRQRIIANHETEFVGMLKS
jgi:hypothetical protein